MYTWILCTYCWFINTVVVFISRVNGSRYDVSRPINRCLIIARQKIPIHINTELLFFILLTMYSRPWLHKALALFHIKWVILSSTNRVNGKIIVLFLFNIQRFLGCKCLYQDPLQLKYQARIRGCLKSMNNLIYSLSPKSKLYL